MPLSEIIHRIDTPLAGEFSTDYLVLKSEQKKVFNPFFTTGIFLFMASMIFKANVSHDWAALPLAVSTIILVVGVWKLSANGKIVFDKKEKKLFRIYKHLGYLQKIFVNPLAQIEGIVNDPEKGFYLKLDNQKEILISAKNVNMEIFDSLNIFLIKT
jgi:hypothetical protein